MIFNLFKSKPTLKELIPQGFVDIHSHILPGVDDGAKDLKESIELLSAMKKMGFSKIIATPHTYPGVHNNDNNDIKKSYDSLIEVTKDNYRIDYASEYLLESSIIDRAKNKSLLTLKKNYVLLELSYIAAPINLNEILFQVLTNDYIPVIAHPERYRFFHNDFNMFKDLKRKGCKFQVNLLSTVGYYGDDVLSICNKLLERGCIDFVGSDIHKKRHVDAFNFRVKTKKINLLEKVIEKNIFFE